jgi:prefoldin alpha subunit
MEKQEYLMRMQVIEEEARQMEMQIEMIDQQTNELIQISKSLEELSQVEENPEFLANLGKGIFIKAKALEKELFVSIGKGIVIKKTSKEAIEIITTQLRRASETKLEFISRINELQMNMQKLVEEAEKTNTKEEHHKKNCECGEDCKCEDEKCECKDHQHKKN